MGPITGLATIATSLLVIVVLSALVVFGLTVAFVVPAARATRTERLRLRLSIPSYYLHPAVAH